MPEDSIELLTRADGKKTINYLRSAFQPQRQTHSVLVLAAIIYSVYLLIACTIASHEIIPPAPPGDARRLFGFQKMTEKTLPNGGVAFFIRPYEFSAFEDSDVRDQKSPLRLYENDKPLGPAHSAHIDIERIGLGRYSHWKELGFLFSTSDNSDPNHNRRAYWAVFPPEER